MDAAVELSADALVFGDLGGVTRAVGEVSGHDQEGWVEPVRVGDDELPVGGFVAEVGVFRLHAELGVGGLDEEGISGGREERVRQ